MKSLASSSKHEKSRDEGLGQTGLKAEAFCFVHQALHMAGQSVRVPFFLITERSVCSSSSRQPQVLHNLVQLDGAASASFKPGCVSVSLARNPADLPRKEARKQPR